MALSTESFSSSYGTTLFAMALPHLGWEHLLLNLVVWFLFAPLPLKNLPLRWTILLLGGGQAAAATAVLLVSPYPIAGGSFVIMAAVGAYSFFKGREILLVVVVVALVLGDVVRLVSAEGSGTYSALGHLVALMFGAIIANVFKRLNPPAHRDTFGDTIVGHPTTGDGSASPGS